MRSVLGLLLLRVAELLDRSLITVPDFPSASADRHDHGFGE
jgi:hypothetical protein